MDRLLDRKESTLTNPYEGLSHPEALRHLAKRYLRKRECVDACTGAAAYIEYLESRLKREQELVDRITCRDAACPPPSMGTPVTGRRSGEGW